jgi:hypothetical protein
MSWLNPLENLPLPYISDNNKYFKQGHAGRSSQKVNNASKNMYKRRKKLYSPNFSELAAVAIRRLAWAMGSNMGQAVDAMVESLPALINAEKVCALCKDASKCTACIFKAGAVPPLKLVDLLK